MFFIRLDDASNYMNVKKWQKVENLLDKYDIKPIVGIIPSNQDSNFLKQYKEDKNFWKKAKAWQDKGWTIALHGFHHTYTTNNAGINPFWSRSEFAEVPLKTQQTMIEEGYQILMKHGLRPTVFFAPSHTFDKNTIQALRQKTDIKIINDTIATDIYYKNGLYFMPQHVGKIRKSIFKNTTKCVHPNEITNRELAMLENFIKNNKINDLQKIRLKPRKENLIDILLRKIYFYKRNKTIWHTKK